MSRLSTLVSLIGIGMAVAGVDKLAGDRAYLRLYRHWGWTRQQMRLTGAAEVAGGTLMSFRRTRRLGGVILGTVSVAQLTAELAHGDGGLAMARSGVLAASLISFLG